MIGQRSLRIGRSTRLPALRQAAVEWLARQPTPFLVDTAAETLVAVGRIVADGIAADPNLEGQRSRIFGLRQWRRHEGVERVRLAGGGGLFLIRGLYPRSVT